MATLEEISGIEGFIRRRVELERKTHEQISEAVKQYRNYTIPRNKGPQ